MDSPVIAEGGEGETRERGEEMSDMERGPGGVEDVTQHQCQWIPHQQQEYQSDLLVNRSYSFNYNTTNSIVCVRRL